MIYVLVNSAYRVQGTCNSVCINAQCVILNVATSQQNNYTHRER